MPYPWDLTIVTLTAGTIVDGSGRQVSGYIEVDAESTIKYDDEVEGPQLIVGRRFSEPFAAGEEATIDVPATDHENIPIGLGRGVLYNVKVVIDSGEVILRKRLRVTEADAAGIDLTTAIEARTTTGEVFYTGLEEPLAEINLELDDLTADVAALAAADTAMDTRVDAVEAKLPMLIGDAGILDRATELQALVDAADALAGTTGTAVIRIGGGGTVLIDTSVFFDSSVTQRQYILEFDGKTTLKLGSNLAEASPFAYDTGIGWAFHVNTNRSALAGGIVTHSDGTRSTGSGFPPAPRLVIKNALVSAADDQTGVVYSNTAAVRFENVSLRAVRFGLSWCGYADGNALVGGQHTPAGVDDAWVIVQEAFGDGVRIDGFKGEESGVWWAKWCNGGKVTASINGAFHFQQCHGIEFDSHHWEANRADWADMPMVHVDRSVVSLNTPFAYCGTTGGRYIVEIEDTSGEDASIVTIRQPHFLKFIADTDDDAGRVADVHITAVNNSSRLRVTNPSGALSVNPGGDSARHNRDGILVTSDVAGITTALAANYGMNIPEAELRFRNAAWEIVAPGLMAGVRLVRALNAPTFSSLATSSTALGSLTEGQAYYYVAAMRDQDGNYTTQSAVLNANAPASGTLLALITATTSPGDLILWRKAGSGVQTAPDAYVVIPFDGYTGRFYDTGLMVNGRPWITTSVPVPDTVAAANATFNRIVLPSGVVIGTGAVSPESTYTAPQGSEFRRTDGVLYLKVSGSGNTGWVAIGPMKSLNTQTTAYTFALSDMGKIVMMNAAGAHALTIPPNSSVAFPVGTELQWYQQGAGLTTVTAGVGVTIEGAPDLAPGQYFGGRIRKRATDTWYVESSSAGGSSYTDADAIAAIESELGFDLANVPDLAAVSNLFTGDLQVDGTVTAEDGNATQVALGALGVSPDVGVAAVGMGSAVDTILGQRAAAGIIRHPHIHQFVSYIEFLERVDPGASAADRMRMFLENPTTLTVRTQSNEYNLVVDGTGVMADRLGGQSSSHHLDRANHTGTELATAGLTLAATDRILGRDTAGAGAVEELTPSAVKTMLAILSSDLSDFATAVKAVVGGGLDATLATVGNTTTETAIYTVVIPAGALAAEGDFVEGIIAGEILTNSGTTNFRFKVNGTEIMGLSATITANATERKFRLSYSFAWTGTDAQSAEWMNDATAVTSSDTTNIQGASFPSFRGNGISTADDGAAITLTVTVQWGAAAANNVITPSHHATKLVKAAA